MSHKSTRVALILNSLESGELDPHYAGFFDCFNRQLFFEAHEVLETLWLKQRGQANDLFYKGLIQLAGAFVHVQKQRRGPAMALLRLSQNNLGRFPAVHQRLALRPILDLAEAWLRRLESLPEGFAPLSPELFPKLSLMD